MSPSGVVRPASPRNTSWKWLKLGRSGTSVISDFTRAANADRSASPPSARRFSMPWQISTRHTDKMGDIAACIVDVRLQQHAVARRLVELDVILARQQALELRSVETRGAADQRHARGIEVELVLPHRLDRPWPRSSLAPGSP